MTELNITATSYALFEGEAACWKCSASIPVTAIWVPGFLDNEDEEYPEEGGPSLLKYVSELDVGTMGRVKAAVPWLKPNFSQTANQTYLANHCKACDELQGDHFVFSPDGPFFPQDQAGVDQLKVIPGHWPLMANASTVQSSWMELVGLPEST
ncbi:hypothetical protein M3O57_18190 [Xanthomonas nasturtii]|uniref:Uncharacterized protein n=1 Tax=Xanthomonas nasturtii TaxID=1843581 RepID=A0A3E1KE16_9XANT|nr:hypothetical protein [Xanthomonas nasturtii]MCL1532527.1 hypothetical protein [Xanthomonas nasturtii]MCL1567303.1 hypothetical protein [Xanthomonas nasturtii]MCL1570939.1 hypothetical protein [Xanthomonas nasturtii]MCL1575071.1 hypothetical protein [Xanthomonas nasturtii]MCL1582488.1 hypothetical protein [Xanthomonas nasturtii]